jgi:signal transduction histidine kinase
VEGRTVRSSPAADTILGIPVGERQEAVGARVMRQYEILTEDGRPQTREEMIAVRAAVHGETVPNALYSVRSGDAPARWLNIGGKPLFLSGQHAGGVISMTDMTERKLAEMELALITRLYAVLSRVNEAIVRIRDERSLYEEVCRIVSKEGGVTIGAITLYAATANSFTDQQVALIESLCADVSFALEAMQQERLRSAAEEQLRLANASLRDADARKDEFLAMLSHELRNPLAPIRNAVHILRHAAPGSAQTIRAQDIIERQAMHMARIVDDLLDVTRIARGKIQLRPSRIELRALVARAAEDFRSLLQDHAVGFEVVLPAGNLWAEADPTRITQVIGNLLHNAAKFTQEVVLCDLGLPGMDGFEVARALRATGPQGLRLIAVSGYGLPEDIRQTLAAGFDSHIIKPSDPEEIIRQVGAGRIARARP